MWGRGAVNHYDKSGRLVETITVPGVSQVSSCTFGGEERGVLYITTSRKDLPASQEPDAGAVFSVQTSVRGASQAEFGG
jgi:sugar lactone lactonase YvrE